MVTPRPWLCSGSATPAGTRTSITRTNWFSIITFCVSGAGSLSCAWRRRAPENVTLLHSAPHDAVMEEVSLVVTHGGHGTLCRALAHGLPLLVVPMGRDQNDNALRLEAHGAGLSLPPTAEIAAGLNRLIAEPRFRLAARRLGEAIAPDLGSDALVKEMEAIAASGRADQIWSHRRVV